MATTIANEATLTRPDTQQPQESTRTDPGQHPATHAIASSGHPLTPTAAIYRPALDSEPHERSWVATRALTSPTGRPSGLCAHRADVRGQKGGRGRDLLGLPGRGTTRATGRTRGRRQPGRVRLPDRDNPTSSSALYVAASDGSNPRRLTPSTLPWLVPEPAPMPTELPRGLPEPPSGWWAFACLVGLVSPGRMGIAKRELADSGVEAEVDPVPVVDADMHRVRSRHAADADSRG